ncbi:hypothetical protein BH10PSE19_BH10PSE19_04110 [soil metagenome]
MYKGGNLQRSLPTDTFISALEFLSLPELFNARCVSTSYQQAVDELLFAKVDSLQIPGLKTRADKINVGVIFCHLLVDRPEKEHHMGLSTDPANFEWQHPYLDLLFIKGGYALFLRSLEEDEEVTVEELEQYSKANGRSPILVKKGDTFKIYGNTDGKKWQITNLDSAICRKYLTEDTVGPLRIEYDYSKNRELYLEIKSKGGHTARERRCYLNSFEDMRRLFDNGVFKNKLQSLGKIPLYATIIDAIPYLKAQAYPSRTPEEKKSSEEQHIPRIPFGGHGIGSAIIGGVVGFLFTPIIIALYLIVMIATLSIASLIVICTVTVICPLIGMVKCIGNINVMHPDDILAVPVNWAKFAALESGKSLIFTFFAWLWGAWYGGLVGYYQSVGQSICHNGALVSLLDFKGFDTSDPTSQDFGLSWERPSWDSDPSLLPQLKFEKRAASGVAAYEHVQYIGRLHQHQQNKQEFGTMAAAPLLARREREDEDSVTLALSYAAPQNYGAIISDGPRS